jgi:hypothetical protein
MTEQDWVQSIDLWRMLEFLEQYRREVTQRKLILCACACCRHIWPFIKDERSRQAVAVVERYADNLATLDELDVASDNSWGVSDIFTNNDSADYDALAAASATQRCPYRVPNTPKVTMIWGESIHPTVDAFRYFR